MSKRRKEPPTASSDRLAIFHPEFREDLRYWIQSDRKVATRLLDLVEATIRDPFQGIGKPEPLKYLLAGLGRGDSLRSIESSILCRRIRSNSFRLGSITEFKAALAQR